MWHALSSRRRGFTAVASHGWVCSPYSLRSSQHPRVQAEPTTGARAVSGLLGIRQGCPLLAPPRVVREEGGTCACRSGTAEVTWSRRPVKADRERLTGNRVPARQAGVDVARLSSLPRAAEGKKGLTPQRACGDSGCEGRPARAPPARVPDHTEQAGAGRPTGTGSGPDGVPPQDAPEGSGGGSKGRSGTSRELGGPRAVSLLLTQSRGGGRGEGDPAGVTARSLAYTSHHTPPPSSGENRLGSASRINSLSWAHAPACASHPWYPVTTGETGLAHLRTHGARVLGPRTPQACTGYAVESWAGLRRGAFHREGDPVPGPRHTPAGLNSGFF